MPPAFTLFDLDGFGDVAPETIAAICFILAVNAAATGVVMIASARRDRVKILNQGTAADASLLKDHPGGFIASAWANKVRGRG